MADYWIRDAEQRVLGPVSLEVLRDLVSARRLVGVDQVSRDGRTWVSVDQFPELRLRPAPVKDAQAQQRAEAAQLRAQLVHLAGRPLHEVFKVPPEAAATTFRASYFALVRRYHPERLPAGVHPDLVAAYQEAFRFFSQCMAQVEERLAPRAPAAPPRPREYRAEDFVGIERRGEDRVHADVRVTPANAGMFTDHQLVNISSGGMFLTTQVLLPLSTLVDLDLTFQGEARHVGARARVVWESSGADARYPRGVGLKFIQLAPDDAAFIRDYVRKTAAARRT
jgi:uncharacterized protein (TIGR02266 family)